jgi:zinc protease
MRVTVERASRVTKLGQVLLLVVGLSACAGPPAAAPPAAPPPPAPPPAPAPVARAPERERPPAAGPIPTVPFPAQSTQKLKNGLEVVTVAHRSLPLVHVVLVVRAGTAADPKDLPGLAGFTAEMLKEGTRTRSKRAIVEEIEFVGGTLQTTATADYSAISVFVLKDHLPVAMKLLADVAQNPIFPPREVEKVRENSLNELRLALADAGFLATRQLAHDLYGEHPYGRVSATEESLGRIQRKDLAAFHGLLYRPDNAILIVAGDADQAQVVKETEKALGRWKPGKPGTAAAAQAGPEPAPQSARTVSLVDRPQSVQSAIRIGNVALARKDPDWIKFAMTNYILGGSASARLFLELREKQGLTYGAYTRVAARVQPGSFVAAAAIRNEVTPKALTAFVGQLERIRKQPVPQGELINAKRYLTGNFTLQLESAGSVAQLVTTQRVFGLGDGYWDRYLAELNGVTPEQVMAMAQKYIRPDQASFVVVGVASQLQEGLTRWGAVSVYDTQGKLVRKLALH